MEGLARDSVSIPLRDIAYRRLRDDVVACRLAPGQLVTERQLAAATGLGISPIREALTRLDHEGLIRKLPRKGYQVKPLTIRTVDNLFEYWQILGPEVIRQGIEGAAPDQIERLRIYIERLTQLFAEEGVSSHDLVGRSQQLADEVFAVLVDGTRNDYIVAEWKRVYVEVGRVFALVMDPTIMVGGDPTRIVNWSEILAARDGDVAADAVRRYIQAAHDRILRILARWPSIINAELVPNQEPG